MSRLQGVGSISVLAWPLIVSQHAAFAFAWFMNAPLTIAFLVCAFVAPPPQLAFVHTTFLLVFGFWLCVVDKPAWSLAALLCLGFTFGILIKGSRVFSLRLAKSLVDWNANISCWISDGFSHSLCISLFL